jgi:hypothetical protein
MLPLPASAHVPLLAGENENISSAQHISDPGKSWAVYGSLEQSEAHYYSFDMEEGERMPGKEIFSRLWRSWGRDWMRGSVPSLSWTCPCRLPT